ncbi:MAG TPA: ComEC/Rec2 family competence protein, partial [Actinomycetota bacterium]|nr:ComEC/Rec2 family competence protein [Actinomycetota bacterium]
MSTQLLVAAAACVAAGVAGGRSWPSHALAWSAACVVALAAGAAAWRAGRIDESRRWTHGAGVVSVLLAAAASGAADAAWRSAAAREGVLPVLARAERVVEVCGVVTGRRPRSLDMSARSVADGADRWAIREPVLVSEAAARPGHKLCARGSLVSPRRGRSGPPLLAADDSRVTGVGAPIRFAAGAVRARFSAAAQDVLPRRQAGLLLGMTDGDIELLDDRTLEDFRTTGLAHLVAVSGSNVAVVLVVVMLVVRRIVPRRRVLRALLAVPPLVFFAFLTALEASVLRAVVTAGVVLAVTSSGRIADGLRAAAVAFIVLVLASPDLMSHPGFQLSFGATVGLILWARPLTDRVLALVPEGRRGGFAQAAAVAVA